MVIHLALWASEFLVTEHGFKDANSLPRKVRTIKSGGGGGGLTSCAHGLVVKMKFGLLGAIHETKLILQAFEREREKWIYVYRESVSMTTLFYIRWSKVCMFGAGCLKQQASKRWVLALVYPLAAVDLLTSW